MSAHTITHIPHPLYSLANEPSLYVHLVCMKNKVSSEVLSKYAFLVLAEFGVASSNSQLHSLLTVLSSGFIQESITVLVRGMKR